MKKFKILSDQNDFLSKESLKRWSQWSSLDVPEEMDFTGLSLQDLPRDVDFVRVSPQQGVDWLPACPVQPVTVSSLGVADTFIRTAKGWNPELLLEKALRRALVARATHLDLRSSAYVIGEGALSRVVAAVALSLGYRDLKLVGDEVDLSEQKQILGHVYMGSKIEVLPLHSLTLQTVGASLLVNTLVLGDHPDLAMDLSYFNFMKKDGLVIDLMGMEAQSAFLDEAQKAHLRTIPGAIIQWERDHLMMEALQGPVGDDMVAEGLRIWGVES